MVTGRCYPTSLVKRIMQYTDVPNIGALKWGSENEDKARQEYISNINAKHYALVVTTSGLVISPKFPFLGASPDGVVNCECHGCGLLEIKWSYKYCNQQPTAEIALSDSLYFLKRRENGNIYLSRSHKHYHQVQGQIALYNSTYCDFATWTPKGTSIERIDRDNPFIADALSQLTSFFTKYLFPELLTHALEPASEAIDDEDEKLYCISCRPEFGQMIACENASCPTAWFHFDCVGLKCALHGKWFCVDCKKYTKNLIITFVLTYKQ